MGHRLLPVLILVALSLVAPAYAGGWKVGVEKEIKPGVYAKLVAEKQGWSIWKFENASGSECHATKPATGVSRPEPFDFGFFFGGYPSIRLAFDYNRSSSKSDTWSTKELIWRVQASVVRPRAQYRLVGEKFMTEFGWTPPFDELDGKKIDLAVEGWRYPEIYVDHVEHKGVVDLLGMRDAADLLYSCRDGVMG